MQALRRCRHNIGNSIIDNPLIMAARMPNFIPPTFWPPNNPDLKMADYKVWSVVQEQIYQTPIHDVGLNDLKQRLLDVSAAVDKRIIYYFLNLNFGRRSSHTRIFLSID